MLRLRYLGYPDLLTHRLGDRVIIPKTLVPRSLSPLELGRNSGIKNFFWKRVCKTGGVLLGYDSCGYEFGSNPLLWRGGRAVEGAALEMLFRGNFNEGSNPSLSVLTERTFPRQRKPAIARSLVFCFPLLRVCKLR